MFKLTTDDIEGKAPEITRSLDDLGREGAHRMILVALELEVEQYAQGLRHMRDELGHAMVVCNGVCSRANSAVGIWSSQDQGSPSTRSSL